MFDALEVFAQARARARWPRSRRRTSRTSRSASSVGQQRTRTVLSLLKDEQFITEKDGGLFYVADPPPEHAAS